MTLTAEGFKRKRFEDYLTELQQQARELWGADVNLTDGSPLGQWIKLIAFQRAEENEALEDLYNADYVDTATGISLDHAVKRIGISRLPADYAHAAVTFTVDPGVAIPVGVLVSTTDKIEFKTITSAEEAGGLASVEVIALQTGPIGNVPANTLTQINTPLAGVLAVANASDATGGRNKETDAELRERYYRSLALGGGAATPSIEAALLQLDDVIDAIVDENELDTMVDGLPPNCIAPFVYGGVDQEIAQTIFAQKTGGIRSFGTTVIDITDSRGKVHHIGFSRPVIVDVDVRLTLTKNADYPADGDTKVKTAIISYIGGVDADGAAYSGQGLGADIIQFKVASSLALIAGIDDVTAELSTDGGVTYSENNIVIDSKSIAQTHYSKVVIQ